MVSLTVYCKYSLEVSIQGTWFHWLFIVKLWCVHPGHLVSLTVYWYIKFSCVHPVRLVSFTAYCTVSRFVFILPLRLYCCCFLIVVIFSFCLKSVFLNVRLWYMSSIYMFIIRLYTFMFKSKHNNSSRNLNFIDMK